MASIFTRIIDGEIPGRIIWRDATCVAMIDIRPLNRGHVLVIPATEVDQWTDLPSEVVTHCTGVAHAVGRAQMTVLSPARIGLMVAGFEVPHTHLHVIPLGNMSHLDFAQADNDPDPADLDAVANLLRDALRAEGHVEVT